MFLLVFLASVRLSHAEPEVSLKQRKFNVEVKHESTLREKSLERETESKRIDKLRSLLVRKQKEVSRRGDPNVNLHNIQRIAGAMGV